MVAVLVIVLFIVFLAGVIVAADWMLKVKYPELSNIKCALPQDSGSHSIDCRVIQSGGANGHHILSVQIIGTIDAPTDMHHTTAVIEVEDVTESPSSPLAVYGKSPAFQKDSSGLFQYHVSIGKLPHQHTVLSDWTPIGRINTEQIILPAGKARKLSLTATITSATDGGRLAWAKCVFVYNSSEPGYIDQVRNAQRIKTLAVPLAFAVTAADNKFPDCQVELIKEWARSNIDISRASRSATKKLERALEETVAFFKRGSGLDLPKICAEIVEISSGAEREEIFELCLRVAAADGCAHVEEVALLKNLAVWLEVDCESFQRMVEAILPAWMHEAKDVEFALGLKSGMTAEQARQKLNAEYRKWNARVTNPDPGIQAQADEMLRLIAEARAECIR